MPAVPAADLMLGGRATPGADWGIRDLVGNFFYKDTKNLDSSNSFIFNSVPSIKENRNNLCF